MTDRLLDIDHPMINVREATAAGETFAAMGVIATPTSLMPGLANRLLCFPTVRAKDGICNYLELVGLTGPEEAPPPTPQLLTQPYGPVSTVLVADDAKALAKRLEGLGPDVGPVRHLQHDWGLPDGSVITPPSP